MKLPRLDAAVAAFGFACLRRFIALAVAAGIYVPIAMDWSADRYGLIGIAFAPQWFLLVASFAVVTGAVVGATVVERVR